MGIASLVLGIIATTGVCISFIPLLNLLNCVTLPLALFGAIFGLVDLLREKEPGQNRNLAVAGLVLSVLALIVGGVRVVISLVTTGGIV